MTETHKADGYFYQRAEFELHMAQKAHAPEAVRAHYQLANLYLERYYNAGDAEPAAIAREDMRMIGTAV